MTATDFQNQIIGLSDYIDGFALKYTRNRENARDLAQETILRAFLNREKFVSNTNMKGWIKVIMRNIFINGVRKKANQMINCDSGHYKVSVGEGHEYTPLEQLMEKQIRREIAGLNEDIRQPFEMHISGFKYKEIAENLNIPIGTVKSRVFLARKKLSNAIIK